MRPNDVWWFKIRIVRTGKTVAFAVSSFLLEFLLATLLGQLANHSGEFATHGHDLLAHMQRHFHGFESDSQVSHQIVRHANAVHLIEGVHFFFFSSHGSNDPLLLQRQDKLLGYATNRNYLRYTKVFSRHFSCNTLYSRRSLRMSS